MNAIAIKVEGVSKQYQIGVMRSSYLTLRDQIVDRVQRLRQAHAKPEKVWVLRNISFELEPGQVLGIIGRNGAGKSTLLKILSRVTKPTEGRIEIYGRVGSLLEVGTGFHPELTGRENVYLSGTILGMRKREIDRKFDEIVAFSGIEKFIDTPAKRYSSGMNVRLGFAVAAHLEPEILIVDEVLAVGDAEFQQKCLGKLNEVVDEGRTVLFVSHNMAAIQSLCSRAIVLNQGEMTYDGNPSSAITHYLKHLETRTENLRHRSDRQGSGEVRIVDIELRNRQGERVPAVACGQDIDIYFYFETDPSFNTQRTMINFALKTQMGIAVLQHNLGFSGDKLGQFPEKGAVVCRLKKLPLVPATYLSGYTIQSDEQILDQIDNALELTVIEGDFFGSGKLPSSQDAICLVDGSWHLIPDVVPD